MVSPKLVDYIYAFTFQFRGGLLSPLSCFTCLKNFGLCLMN